MSITPVFIRIAVLRKALKVVEEWAFCPIPTWDSIFHACFMPSQLGIRFFTRVLRRPDLGFDFSRVLCAVRLSDFVFHECYAPSRLGIWFFTRVLRCPTLGFRFSRVFCAVPTWDLIFHACFAPSQLGIRFSYTSLG